MKKTNTGVSTEAIDLFQGELGFELPSGYRKFLLQYNGGKFDAIFTCDVGEVMVDYMFGIGLQPNLDLRYWLKEFESDIIENSLIIGADPGSGFFLLIVDFEDAGVYYYDQSYRFSTSNDDENTYLIDRDVSAFLSRLC